MPVLFLLFNAHNLIVVILFPNRCCLCPGLISINLSISLRPLSNFQVAQWGKYQGFKFSLSKFMAPDFLKIWAFHRSLYLGANLFWLKSYFGASHQIIKDRATKVPSILRVLPHLSWWADQTTLQFSRCWTQFMMNLLESVKGLSDLPPMLRVENHYTGTPWTCFLVRNYKILESPTSRSVFNPLRTVDHTVREWGVFKKISNWISSRFYLLELPSSPLEPI